ncbi:hypothetical protein J7T55_010342 [Diaporthe amygdali]|uniref:uncharacterized protein n=1 Tax=Phomopsis amygdali TaxID=1214568 RepID=UPI0022FE72EC|nr:uncharacterized protein J7T55_010342 [Diaporthe amygdali]KAJ0107735.1 hypothetical protein J7T55_010342 [Diaporthe amygdali]
MLFTVLPPLLQSQSTDFTDWVSLITLCLAPLIAHLAAGAPQPSYLTPVSPRWHDRLCHYIPTSIMWRYAAITDRRIRSFGWDIQTIAAANALFWTPRGWDGSEQMAACSLEYCTYLPETARVEMLSWDMAKTLITTLQGVQAIYDLGGNPSLNGPMRVAVNTIFSPLAILGLYRLSAALWLTTHFNFAPRSQVLALGFTRRLSLDSLLEEPEKPPTPVHYYRATSYLPSRVFRSIFSLPMLILWLLLLFHTFGSPITSTQSFSFLICNILYHLILAPSLVIIGYYFARGMTTTTIIPCISATWYKIYSVTVMGLMLGLIAVSSVETRKTPCGTWTATSGFNGDYWTCKSRTSEFIRVDPGLGGNAFGIASTYSNTTAGSMLEAGQFWVDNFTGSCIGTWSSQRRVRGTILDTVQAEGLVWPSP